MKTEFCHICKQPIEEGDLFWLMEVEVVNTNLERKIELKKICTNDFCDGECRFWLLISKE